MEKHIYCNKCGKKLISDREEYLTVEKQWGYFSQKDQKTYQFHICETCFSKLVGEFQIPVRIWEQTELL